MNNYMIKYIIIGLLYILLAIFLWVNPVLAACHGIPDPKGKPIQEGPVGYSGLYLMKWELPEGVLLGHLYRFETDGTNYILENYPLFYIVATKEAQLAWVDQGDKMGECEYIVRY